MQPTTTSAEYPAPTARDHIDAYENIRRKAYIQLAVAQTDEERADAWLWIDNADRNIARWQRLLPWGQ